MQDPLLLEYIRVDYWIMLLAGFLISEIELEKVADVFFPDQTALRSVKDVLKELKKKQDLKEFENDSPSKALATVAV